MKELQELFTLLPTGDLFPLLVSWLGISYNIANWAARVAWDRWELALKEPGPDRDGLIKALEAGNEPREFYVRLLGRVLDQVDRRLGDAGVEQSLPRPFRNWPKAPYWTGSSFGTIAYLEFFYPFISLFLIWICTGDAGDVGRELGFKPQPETLPRAIAAGATIYGIFAIRRLTHCVGKLRLAWSLLSVTVLVVAFFCAGVIGTGFSFAAGASDVAGVAVVVGAFILAGAVAPVVGFFAVAAVAGAGALLGYLTPAGAGAGTVAGAAIGAFVVRKQDWLGGTWRKLRLPVSWLFFWPLMLAACYLVLGTEIKVGSSDKLDWLLVVFGIVPLMNMPFDWASVGITRALLRRGCEPNAPPLALLKLSLIDFAIGLALLILLACALILALQAAELVSRCIGSMQFIKVIQHLQQIHNAPLDRGNFWIYLTLFSTLLPSALNCHIAILSVTTVILLPQWLREYLINKIKALEPVGHAKTRSDISFCLTLPIRIETFLSSMAIFGLWICVPYSASAPLRAFYELTERVGVLTQPSACPGVPGKTFNHPEECLKYSDPTTCMSVDFCREPTRSCGKLAADLFCRLEGFSSASNLEPTQTDKTIILGTGEQCKGPMQCGMLDRVVCVPSLDCQRGCEDALNLCLQIIRDKTGCQQKLQNCLKSCSAPQL